ncbi:hypothetical protein AMJ71_10075 [candidate division TA06 bacterium SM1_40]|uniref:Uncharacterized protein n=1 Tax=candidate division TA06 bacterium SM1_40 TaxID=1703773 RepID=A0A0S8J9F5_UNCT6|nr:MAG: hypothetical protein AMJ71_10075 [candidate division TA06 bacterium SM1_40]
MGLSCHQVRGRRGCRVSAVQDRRSSLDSRCDPSGGKGGVPVSVPAGADLPLAPRGILPGGQGAGIQGSIRKTAVRCIRSEPRSGYRFAGAGGDVHSARSERGRRGACQTHPRSGDTSRSVG